MIAAQRGPAAQRTGRGGGGADFILFFYFFIFLENDG